MINISEMVSGSVTVSRKVLGMYKKKSILPVIAVWNVTNLCNLKCKHCYASSGIHNRMGELTTDEAINLIDQLKEISIKILIFSGGEPLLRSDIFELIKYANKKGFKTILSTNGSIVNWQVFEGIKECGVDYVGISIDGRKEVNDWFRGVKGVYDKALYTLKTLNELGLKTGIRFTVTRYNIRDLNYILAFIEQFNIPRICIYHLIPSGRGSNLIDWDLTSDMKRRMIETLLGKALEWKENKIESEIETVGSPEDGIYVYLLLKRDNDPLADNAYDYLLRRGGDPSGDRLINIDHMGNIHPNQFWWEYTFGNVREHRLKDVLVDNPDDFLKMLRVKPVYLKGRCGDCPFKNVCNGFRVRALKLYGDPWEEDPGCYIKDIEFKEFNRLSN